MTRRNSNADGSPINQATQRIKLDQLTQEGQDSGDQDGPDDQNQGQNTGNQDPQGNQGNQNDQGDQNDVLANPGEHIKGQLTEAQLLEAKEILELLKGDHVDDAALDDVTSTEGPLIFRVSAPLSVLVVDDGSIEVGPLVEILKAELLTPGLVNAGVLSEQLDEILDSLSRPIGRYVAFARTNNVPLERIEVVFSDVNHDKVLQSINLMRAIVGQPPTHFYPAMAE